VIPAFKFEQYQPALTYKEIVPELEQELYEKYGLKGNELFTFLGNDIVSCAICVADSWGQMLNSSDEVDEWGIGYRTVKHRNGIYAEMVYRPLKKASLKDLKNYKVPDPEDEERYSGVIRLKEKFGDMHAVMVDLSCTIFGCPGI